MNHPSTLISAFLDGEITTSEMATLESHLATCGKCAAELQDVQRVRAAVRSLPVLELPLDLVYEGEPNVVPLHRHRLVWASAAAVVAVVITLATLLTPSPASMTVDELSSRFGARVSLDPAFGAAKFVVPGWESQWVVRE